MKKILKTLFAKIPHTTIVNCFGDKYLTRWYLFRRKSMGLFLHLFHRSDEDRAFHDHPWNFISLILWRGYHEHTDIRCTLCVGGLGYNAFSPVACPRCNGTEIERVKRRKYPGMILYRPAEWAHRVELLDGKPALTLILRFKNRREWGYHLATGWLSHDKWWSNNCE